MFRTKVINSLEEVDVFWAFGYYLNAQLDSKNNNVLSSIFNKENTPSMHIFSYKGTWVFKCFSSGNSGSIIELIKLLYKLNSGNAAKKLISDYQNYIQGIKTLVINHNSSSNNTVTSPKFKVSDYNIRKWNKADKDFWTRFNVDKTILDLYLAAPLSNYTLSKKITETEIITYTFEKKLLYGYFNKEGDLYKIYQPGQKPKSMSVKSYLQGVDQLTFKTKGLIITKSLKDVMSFYSLGIKDWEAVSMESESIMIKPEKINEFKKVYSNIVTILDNDVAGKQTALKYKKFFNLPTLEFNLGFKDLSDTVEGVGVEKTKYYLAKSLASKSCLTVFDCD